MWPDVQASFAAALRDRAGMVPGISGGDNGATAERRLGIYRNNIAVGLREALEATYPTVAALLGGDCFNEAARRFVGSCPPASPVLLEYGAAFAAFIEASDLADTVPYVSDVARLDWLRHEAAHAADAEAMSIGALGTLDEDAVDTATLRLHPSVRLLASDWPVASIWHAHQQPDTAAALAALPRVGEKVLIVRPALDVEVRTLGDDAYRLISALAGGAGLADALDTVGAVEDADPVASLAGLFNIGAVAGVIRHGHSEGKH